MKESLQLKQFLVIGSLVALLMLLGCVGVVKSIYAK
jgi:hypothetical protein